jgi:hypothetical protein
MKTARLILISIFVLGVSLQTFARPRLCSSVFETESGISKPSELIRTLLTPKSINRFDAELYWYVKTTPTQNLNLSNKEMKKLETKLALIDKILPISGQSWASRLLSLKLMRLREVNKLFSGLKLSDLQDPFLRKQFITQLYLVSQSPWIGLQKSIEISRIESVSAWSERTTEQRLLNEGIPKILNDLGFSEATDLQKFRLTFKRVISSGILQVPLKLPMIAKSLDGKSMSQDHAIDIYNNISRVYGKAAMAVIIAVLYYTLPELQKDIEERINEKFKENEMDPENIRKREEAFNKAMNELDKVSEQIEQLSNQDPKQAMFEETLELFESMNHRKATASEILQLKQQIGIP